MTSTGLKLLALALMLIDHMGEFIPTAPLWFRWIGRLSAPLFFFCAAQGLYHTRDRKKYLLRLYIFGVVMAAIGFVCNNFVQPRHMYVTNNIFVTIFSFGMIVTLIELWLKDKRRGTLFILLYILVQVLALMAPALTVGSELYGINYFMGAVLGSAVMCEGGPAWVLLGVILYWARDDKRRIIAGYSVLCLYFLLEPIRLFGWSRNLLLYNDFQWMMIFSLPLMLLYNGKKGAGLKYFFYFFYPAHIVALFLIGNAMY